MRTMVSRKMLRRSASPRSALGTRAILALFAALVAYCLLSAIAGPAGVLAYRGLWEHRAVMADNLNSLSQLNARLRGELESLKSDSDRAAREARGLGYLRPGETEVVLSGRDASLSAPDVGKVIPLLPSAGLPDMVIKEVAAGMGLAVFALGVLRRRLFRV